MNARWQSWSFRIHSSAWEALAATPLAADEYESRTEYLLEEFLVGLVHLGEVGRENNIFINLSTAPDGLWHKFRNAELCPAIRGSGSYD